MVQNNFENIFLKHVRPKGVAGRRTTPLFQKLCYRYKGTGHPLVYKISGLFWFSPCYSTNLLVIQNIHLLFAIAPF